MDQRPNYLQGRWTPAAAAREVHDPTDPGTAVGSYAVGGVAEVASAVDGAAKAAPAWAAVEPTDRFEVLDTVGRALMDRLDGQADLLARSVGTPLPAAVDEVRRAATVFKHHAGIALRPGVGDRDDPPEPVGVVGILTPWPSPMVVGAWRIAAALAYGNAVVYSPAPAASAVAWSLTEILSSAGLPPGTFNLVMGGDDVGSALASHDGIDALSFTGSPQAGREVVARVAARLAPVQASMGGRCVLVVLDDADVEAAAEIALRSAFATGGHRCSTARTVLVADPLHDRFTAALTSRVAALQVGNPRHPGTDVGPLLDAGMAQQHADWVARLEAAGGTATTPAKPAEHGGPHVAAPTIVAGLDARTADLGAPVWGPAVGVARVLGLEDALAACNSDAGLFVAAVCTRSLSAAQEFRRAVRSAVVAVNQPTVLRDDLAGPSSRGHTGYGLADRELHTAAKLTLR